MGPLIRPLRSFANGLGLAWWARVQTHGPDVTYWFGPFVTRGSLERELPLFLEDVASEAPVSIDHSCLRCRRGEPFTIPASDG
ncbi:DUF1816 domain-containing protein [Synechococcus sp. BS55D]|uniref:DUF1816 domain-containing protein n=1 Tax=Synechococcus sp. BS55D TaxID=2055943 RepID=UPI00103DE08A|nr:DUF1816 domain-containing protein [Synechococcus sp. BS55D]TCD57070.1 hypothetical protein CWE16_04575 [Synechococcus sp. BS55D]